VVSLKPAESESDDESVFNYMFPEGLDKKEKSSTKSKALIGKNDFSEKVYNLKKEQKKKQQATPSQPKSKQSARSDRSKSKSQQEEKPKKPRKQPT